MKLKGKFITDKLSGRKGIVLEKAKGKGKGVWTIRVYVAEQQDWITMDCPRKQFKLGDMEPQRKIGF